MKPKILLSAGAKAENYEDAVRAAGGEPVLYQKGADLSGMKGLILCGGGDIEPRRYAQVKAPETDRIDPDRDEREFFLLRRFLSAGRPVLGICRGLQVINVFFGGSLIQHLPDFRVHRNPESSLWDLVHPSRAGKDSFLARLYGGSFPVNSAHHQAVDRLGTGLRAVQFADRNVIEGVCHSDFPLWAVQWHPERLRGSFARRDAVNGDLLFAFFLSRIKGERS